MLADMLTDTLGPVAKLVSDSGLDVTLNISGNKSGSSDTLPNLTSTFPTGLAIGIGVTVLAVGFLFVRNRKK